MENSDEPECLGHFSKNLFLSDSVPDKQSDWPSFLGSSRMVLASARWNNKKDIAYKKVTWLPRNVNYLKLAVSPINKCIGYIGTCL